MRPSQGVLKETLVIEGLMELEDASPDSQSIVLSTCWIQLFSFSIFPSDLYNFPDLQFSCFKTVYINICFIDIRQEIT